MAGEALKQFMALNKEASRSDVKNGLKELMKALQDERRAQGISCD